MRSLLILLIVLGLSGCGTRLEIPLDISTSRNVDGSVLIKYKNSGKRDLCVSKLSLSIDPLSDFPGNRQEKKVTLSELDRKFLEFQYFSNKNLAEIEAWRSSGITSTNSIERNISFQLLIQAVYCDELFSDKKKVKVFEYFEVFSGK